MTVPKPAWKLSKSEYLKIGILLAIFVTGVTTAYLIQRPERQLPILNPSDLNPALVADSLEGKGMDHRVANFDLVDQTGTRRSARDVEGKVRIVSYFFTTCPTICVDMAAGLRRVQDTYAGDGRIRILSHTAMPEYDSVPILADYAARNGCDSAQWWLLTGTPEELNRLARTSYFAVLEEGQGWDEHSFIHTENLVLVDAEGRLRGYYDGTDPKAVDQLIKDIPLLLPDAR
ncbi:MAG: SCO family protein [Schleiferiaceae bacterium]|nr:SCO family protein [Schleiferiaceae bacterium]MDP4833062.1 SCO family protein [Schleiferiaceae bacterium]